MNIYLMYVMIIILTVIFFFIIKDKAKAIKLTGILTISSSILLISMIFIIKLILKESITSINISVITDYLFREFTTTSILLFTLGLIEILVGKYIHKKRQNIKNNPKTATTN